MHARLLNIANDQQVNGWGLNAENLQPETLQKAVLPVRTYWDCYLENKDFFSLHLKPGINFCAGKNGMITKLKITQMFAHNFLSKARALVMAIAGEAL